MALFNDDVKQKLREMLANLQEDVHLLYFTQEFECRTCQDGRQFVSEIAELSEKISVTTYEFENEKEVAEAYGVDKVPAIVVLDKDKQDYGIRFYGVPGGYEINSFLTALHEMSGVGEPMPEALAERIKNIDKDVHIQVFVTLVCPHCPGAVSTAHRLALENPHIKADMVDVSLYPDMSMKYGVMGVPKIVINEEHELIGNQPITAFLQTIENV